MAQYARPVAPQEQPVAPTQQAYVPMQMQNFIKGRPVVSIDEARASQIDLDGSLYVFPDIGNKKIYTKQINMDGTALLNMYELKELPIEQELSNNQYITREEFESVISQLTKSFAATGNAQSVPTNKSVGKPSDAGVALNF